MSDQSGKAWFISKERRLHEIEYSGVANVNGNAKTKINIMVDFEDVFSVTKVPDMCVVKQFGIEQNCTFPSVVHVQLFGSKSDGDMTTNDSFKCSISNNSNQTSGFSTELTHSCQFIHVSEMSALTAMVKICLDFYVATIQVMDF